MKKLFSVLLALVLLVPMLALAAPQTVDLDTMSLDELIAFNQQVVKAIMANKDFKEVSVPSGAYEVGVHIPAGDYEITTTATMGTITVTGTSAFPSMHIISKQEGLGRLVLKDGETIEISCVTIFKPFAGLGF